MIAKGKIQDVDFQPNENGGTRILKGFMVAGKEGEELSWKLQGRAEVKVSIWAWLPPQFSLSLRSLVSRLKLQSHFYFVRNWH